MSALASVELTGGDVRLRILRDVSHERERQLRKWGAQPLPMALPSDRYSTLEEMAKANCDLAMEQDCNTHALVIAEEAAETYAAAQAFNVATPKHRESARQRLRTELVQLAACCVKALEQLDLEATS